MRRPRSPGAMKRPTLEQILRPHARPNDRFGGAPGVRDPSALDAAMARPFAAFGGHEGFPTAVKPRIVWTLPPVASPRKAPPLTFTTHPQPWIFQAPTTALPCI
jgi:hypothetical protein